MSSESDLVVYAQVWITDTSILELITGSTGPLGKTAVSSFDLLLGWTQIKSQYEEFSWDKITEHCQSVGSCLGTSHMRPLCTNFRDLCWFTLYFCFLEHSHRHCYGCWYQSEPSYRYRTGKWRSVAISIMLRQSHYSQAFLFIILLQVVPLQTQPFKPGSELHREIFC